MVAPAGDGAPAAYYLRFLVTDAPGVLAQVATELGAAGISINRMRQVEHAGEEAPILIVTHRAERAALDRGARAPSPSSRSAARRRWRSASRRREACGARAATSKTGGARVRPSTEADLAAIQAIYARHVRDGLASFEEVPPDLAEMARRRAEVVGRGLPHLVAEVDGQALGYAYAGPYRTRIAYRFTVEDSVYVAPEATGRGLGRLLLAELIREVRGLGGAADGGGDRRQRQPRLDPAARAGGVPRGGHAEIGRLQARAVGRFGLDAASARAGRRDAARGVRAAESG